MSRYNVLQVYSRNKISRQTRVHAVYKFRIFAWTPQTTTEGLGRKYTQVEIKGVAQGSLGTNHGR